MLQTLRGRAEHVVLRYPFTTTGTLFALVLVLALQPVVFSGAGSSVANAPLAAPVRALTTAPADTLGLPGLLWRERSIARARVFGIAATPRIDAARPAMSFGPIDPVERAGDRTEAAALAEWAQLVGLVSSVTGRPSQASHDLAR